MRKIFQFSCFSRHVIRKKINYLLHSYLRGKCKQKNREQCSRFLAFLCNFIIYYCLGGGHHAHPGGGHHVPHHLHHHQGPDCVDSHWRHLHTYGYWSVSIYTYSPSICVPLHSSRSPSHGTYSRSET